MQKIRQYLDIGVFPPEKRRSFLFNLLLGTGFVLFFSIYINISMYQGVINAQFDKCIQRRMQTMTNEKLASCAIAFLDFDQEALADMGRPEQIPRDKVAELVRIAYEGKAKIIVLDMLFSTEDFSPGGKERDDALQNLLVQIQKDTKSETVVLIPMGNYADGELKHNLFSSLVDKHKIYAVTPNFTADKKESIVRFWLPYYETKENGNSGLLWSIPLTVRTLLTGRMEQLEKQKNVILLSDENSFTLPSTNSNENEAFVFFRERLENDDIVRDASAAQYNRIQYSILPPEEPIAIRKFANLPHDSIGHWRADTTNHINNGNFDCKDKIVLIGRTDPDCGDFHSTPVGQMPGLYIHGNSIATLMQQTQPHLAPALKQFVIDLLLVVITAYAYVNLSLAKSKVFIFLLAGTAAFLSYQYFCMTNEFVYLSFSFLSIGAYNFILELMPLLNRLTQKEGKKDVC